jgi:hypothetical protein
MKKHIHPSSGKTHWFSQIGPSASYAFALALALAFSNIAAFAQISIPNAGFTYTQDFNTLAASGTNNTAVPSGWAFFETSFFYSVNTTYRAGDASGDYSEQTFDTYSLGATGNSDRAFGSITSTGQDTLNTTIGACFTNNTGATITSFTITYTGETWRVASPNRVDGLVFQYNQNTTGINGAGTWTPFTALNYFNPGDPTEGGGSMRHSTVVSATISGLNIAPGNTFCFRWLNFDATRVPFTNNPNQEDAIGIDDFSLGNIVACAPPVVTVPTVTQPTCAAPSGGAITVNATGIGTLEYSINNGGTWDTNPVFSGLASGNYFIKVRLQANPTCEATYGSNPVVLTSPFTASTTTDTWTGCVSTNWATAGNWADGSVPTAADDVTIPNVANDPVIMGVAAVAKSVLVQPGAVCTIQATGSLDIYGSTGFALENFGTLDNSGTIRIGNISSVANRGIVHRNGGTLNNKPGGLIQIDRTSAAEAFYTSGVVNNEGTLEIGSVAEVTGHGVTVDGAGTFNNKTDGLLTVNRSTAFAVENYGTLDNMGTIRIGNITSVANRGIVHRNGGALNNKPGGLIQIDRTSAAEAFYTSGVVNNEGTLEIGSITAVTGNGVTVDGAGTFNNQAGGLLIISLSTISGIQNSGAFNNNACATVTVFDNLNNAGTFTNAGLMTFNTTQAHTNSALTNNGIIAYPQGNPIPNVTNNEIIIAPTTANDCDVISPAFALGSPVDFTIMGIFTDEAATMSAGTYVTATNTFTPTAILAEGAYTYYVKIADNNGGCTSIVPWQLTTEDCCPTTGTIWYVNAAATGNNDGTSWADAFTDLQSALLSTCPDITQIWVAAGTYKPTSGTDRNISFSMKDGVGIYGGFNGTETLLSQRNWTANVTTLSGEIGAAGMADNTFNIVRNGAMSSTAILDGFQIAFGNASGGNDRGGALHNGANASPTIRNCTFLSNLGGYGGAVYSFTFCTPTFTNCTFIGNQAGDWGSAIMTEGGSSASVINCTFSGNSASFGTVFGNSPYIIKNSIFWGNSGGSVNDNAGSSSVTHSIVQGGFAGMGNLNLDPLFVSQPPIGLGTAGDLRLQICSPAIDAGNDSDNTTLLDLAGNPRKFESILYGQMIDMGAYEYQSSSRPGDPAVFGNNVWNAYVWRAGGASLPNSSAWNDLYSGYYVENNLSINTEARWPANGAPSQASGYQGCAVDNDNHSYSYKRKGFPAAYYQLNIDGHDDAAQLWINGTNVWQHSGCCDAHVNVWAGNLGANDEVEFRVTEGTGGSIGKLSIIKCPTGNVLYVNDDATGTNDGSSWTDAFTDLQSALNSTCFGVTEIWVAAGTYKPTNGTDRNISFVMKNGVGIYGGFNGTEALLSQRNWTTNVTTLSGDIGTAGNNSDNSYHVIFNNNNGLTNTAVLDGFTITGGNANGSFPNERGGGVLNLSSSPSLANCSISDNEAGRGGGIFSNSPLSLTDCTISGNYASAFGGGVFTSGATTITGTTIDNNEAGNAGGIFHANASLSMTNCNITNNRTIFQGAGVNLQDCPNATLTNCLISGNSSQNSHGGILNGSLGPAARLYLINTTVTQNTSVSPFRAVWTAGANAITYLKNTIVAGNTPGNFVNSSGGVVLSQGNNLDGDGTSGFINGTNGDIVGANPLFTSATDFRLQACSPAVNTGSNAAVPGGVTTDLDNNPRTFGGTVDMGAYEYQAAPTPIVPVCQNQTVFLNNMGMATFSPALLSNGTTGCGTLLYTVGGQSTLNFTCADIGAPIPVTLTVTDDRGITATCSATITVADNTAPSITCPATQTLALGANCTATLPNYTSLATTGDNCGVQGVTQSPAAGTTVSSAGNMTVTLTVTDVNGLTNSCTFTVTKVDNTAPTISCPATQTLALGANCTASLPNYTSLATTGDGCGVQSVTQSPAAGTTVSSAGNMTVTLTVTDANGNTANCTFTVSKVDNTPPTVECINQTVYFNGEESIALDADDLAEASDNCGVQSISLSPNTISAERVGQIVPVTVTATDINGNTATCTAQITVSGFPAGWSQQPGGAGCSGNNNTYNSGTGVWTATSTNCFYGPPYTSDATSFVQRTLCGDGSLTAQVTSISGSALGWAGIVMRESNAPGAKKAQLMTNLSSLHRREFRTTTNGAAQPQQSASNGRYWLRITRAGNQFTMSVSANGMSWFLIGAQNIVMGNCIQMGLIATNYTANSTVTATFAGVSYTGSNATATSFELRAASIEQPHSLEVYPNPTSGELNLDLTQYIGRSVRIETYSLEGKLLQFTEIEEVQTTVEQLDMSQLENGMYLVKVRAVARDGISRERISRELPDAVRRIVLNRN